MAMVHLDGVVFGVGGGFLMTPLLIFMGIPPAVAVGTEAPHVLASSISGSIAHWSRKNIDIKVINNFIGKFFIYIFVKK